MAKVTRTRKIKSVGKIMVRETFFRPSVPSHKYRPLRIIIYYHRSHFSVGHASHDPSTPSIICVLVCVKTCLYTQKVCLYSCGRVSILIRWPDSPLIWSPRRTEHQSLSFGVTLLFIVCSHGRLLSSLDDNCFEAGPLTISWSLASAALLYLT